MPTFARPAKNKKAKLTGEEFEGGLGGGYLDVAGSGRDSTIPGLKGRGGATKDGKDMPPIARPAKKERPKTLWAPEAVSPPPPPPLPPLPPPADAGRRSTVFTRPASRRSRPTPAYVPAPLFDAELADSDAVVAPITPYEGEMPPAGWSIELTLHDAGLDNITVKAGVDHFLGQGVFTLGGFTVLDNSLDAFVFPGDWFLIRMPKAMPEFSLKHGGWILALVPGMNDGGSLAEYRSHYYSVPSNPYATPPNPEIHFGHPGSTIFGKDAGVSQDGCPVDESGFMRQPSYNQTVTWRPTSAVRSNDDGLPQDSPAVDMFAPGTLHEGDLPPEGSLIDLTLHDAENGQVIASFGQGVFTLDSFNVSGNSWDAFVFPAASKVFLAHIPEALVPMFGLKHGGWIFCDDKAVTAYEAQSSADRNMSDQIHALFDLDRDGFLNLTEMQALTKQTSGRDLLAEQGLCMSKDALFDTYADGDGGIADDFEILFRGMSDQIHTITDADGDGFLNCAEYQALVKQTADLDFSEEIYVALCAHMGWNPEQGLSKNDLFDSYALAYPGDDVAADLKAVSSGIPRRLNNLHEGMDYHYHPNLAIHFGHSGSATFVKDIDGLQDTDSCTVVIDEPGIASHPTNNRAAFLLTWQPRNPQRNALAEEEVPTEEEESDDSWLAWNNQNPGMAFCFCTFCCPVYFSSIFSLGTPCDKDAQECNWEMQRTSDGELYSCKKWNDQNPVMAFSFCFFCCPFYFCWASVEPKSLGPCGGGNPDDDEAPPCCGPCTCDWYEQNPWKGVCYSVLCCPFAFCGYIGNDQMTEHCLNKMNDEYCCSDSCCDWGEVWECTKTTISVTNKILKLITGRPPV